MNSRTTVKRYSKKFWFVASHLLARRDSDLYPLSQWAKLLHRGCRGKGFEIMVSAVDRDQPSILMTLRFTNDRVVHSSMACCAQNDDILRCQAFGRGVVTKMEQMVDFAISLSIPHEESVDSAKLTTISP